MGSHQPAPDEIEGLLAGPEADAVAVAAEVAFYGFGFVAVTYCYVDQADGLFFCAAAGAGDAGDAYSHAGSGALADASGHHFCHVGADCSVGFEQPGRDAAEVDL